MQNMYLFCNPLFVLFKTSLHVWAVETDTRKKEKTSLTYRKKSTKEFLLNHIKLILWTLQSTKLLHLLSYRFHFDARIEPRTVATFARQSEALILQSFFFSLFLNFLLLNKKESWYWNVYYGIFCYLDNFAHCLWCYAVNKKMWGISQELQINAVLCWLLPCCVESSLITGTGGGGEEKFDPVVWQVHRHTHACMLDSSVTRRVTGMHGNRVCVTGMHDNRVCDRHVQQ